MKNEYLNIIKIVNSNLKDNGLEEIYFEDYDLLKYNLFAFPKEELLKIEDNEKFLREAYYKILDRPIDNKALDFNLLNLKNNKITKEQIIENIRNSTEAKVKKTNLVD